MWDGSNAAAVSFEPPLRAHVCCCIHLSRYLYYDKLDTDARLAIACAQSTSRLLQKVQEHHLSSSLQTRTHREHSESQCYQSSPWRRHAGKLHALGPVRLSLLSEALQHIVAFVGIIRSRVIRPRLKARIDSRAIFVGIYVQEANRHCRSFVGFAFVR